MAAAAAALLALASALTAAASPAPSTRYSLFGGPLPAEPARRGARQSLLAHAHHHHGAVAAAAGRPPPEDAPWWAHAVRAREGTLRFDEASPANGRVTVREVGRYRFLLFGDTHIQSVAEVGDGGDVLPDAPVAGYTQLMLAAVAGLASVSEGARVLVAGAGGGALALAAAAAFPRARVEACDVDPVVLRAGAAWMGLPPAGGGAPPRPGAAAPGLAVFSGDALARLASAPPSSHAAIFIDIAGGAGAGSSAEVGGGFATAALAPGALASAAAALAPGGVLVINVLALDPTPEGREARVLAVGAAVAAALGGGAPYSARPPPSPLEDGNTVVVGVKGVPATDKGAAAARARAGAARAAAALALDGGGLLASLAPVAVDAHRPELK